MVTVRNVAVNVFIERVVRNIVFGIGRKPEVRADQRLSDGDGVGRE